MPVLLLATESLTRARFSAGCTWPLLVPEGRWGAVRGILSVRHRGRKPGAGEDDHGDHGLVY